MSDYSTFKIELPRVFWAEGTAEGVYVFRSARMSDDHPALKFVKWYAKERGLVAVFLDRPDTRSGSEKFYEGCLTTAYVTPAARMASA